MKNKEFGEMESKKFEEIKTLFNIPTIGGISACLQMSSDGQYVLYNTNVSGKMGLYYQNTQDSSDVKRVTPEDKDVHFGVICPNRNIVIYMQDDGGDEKQDLYLVNLDDNKDKVKITSNTATTYPQTLTWNSEGNEILRGYADGSKNVLQAINIDTLEIENIYEAPFAIMSAEYSNNNEWIACTGFDGRSFVVLVNRDNPEIVKTIRLAENSYNATPTWSPDDSTICFTTDINGYMQPVLYEISSGNTTFVELDEMEECEIKSQIATDIRFSKDGKSIYFLVSKDAQAYIKECKLENMEQRIVPFPDGTNQEIVLNRAKNILVTINSSMNSNSNVYGLDLNQDKLYKISQHNYEDILKSLPKPESVWIESFDGRKIHAWYLRGYGSNIKKVPAMVQPHGGPRMHIKNEWSMGVLTQAFARAGYSVLIPNYRGSTGFGDEFMKLNVGDIGGGDLKDNICCMEWLKTRDEVDQNNINILGASYGGYLTLMALAKYPDTFRTGVSLIPVVDWKYIYEKADTRFKGFAKYLLNGTPEEKGGLYKDRSVATHAHNIKSYLLVIASENDYRCPIEPIREIRDILEKSGAMDKCKFIIEKAGGHLAGFENSEAIYKKVKQIIEFMEENKA